MTAKVSIGVLQARPGDAFRRLLMTRTTLWRKCDAFVQASDSDEMWLDDHRRDSFFFFSIWGILLLHHCIDG